MYVIRHDHITANSYVKITLGTLRKKNKRFMEVVTCQKPRSLVCAECDEIQRTRIKKAIKTQRSLLEPCVHVNVVDTALWAVQSEGVMSGCHQTGHRPVATGS
jgi:hypothetical protein